VAAKLHLRLTDRARLDAIVSSIRRMGAGTSRGRALNTSEAFNRVNLSAPSMSREGNNHLVARPLGPDVLTRFRRPPTELGKTTHAKTYSYLDDILHIAKGLDARALATTAMLPIALRAPGAPSAAEARRLSRAIQRLGVDAAIGLRVEQAQANPTLDGRRQGIRAQESRRTFSTTQSQATERLASLVASIGAKVRPSESPSASYSQPNWPSNRIVTPGAKVGSLDQPSRERPSRLIAAAKNDSSVLAAHLASNLGIMNARNFGIADTLHFSQSGIGSRLAAADTLYCLSDRYRNPHLPSAALSQHNSRVAEISKPGEQWSAFQPPAAVALPNPRGRSAGPLAGSSDLEHSIVLNFSPTVVVRSDAETGNIAEAVMQAIRRHGHELVHIINREMETRKRTRF